VGSEELGPSHTHDDGPSKTEGAHHVLMSYSAARCFMLPLHACYRCMHATAACMLINPRPSSIRRQPTEASVYVKSQHQGQRALAVREQGQGTVETNESQQHGWAGDS
jgi:hypothetical protein